MRTYKMHTYLRILCVILSIFTHWAIQDHFGARAQARAQKLRWAWDRPGSLRHFLGPGPGQGPKMALHGPTCIYR